MMRVGHPAVDSGGAAPHLAAFPLVRPPRAPRPMLPIRPWLRSAALLAALLLPLSAAPARAADAPADTAALRRQLQELARGYGGVVGISVRNLNTGEAVSLRGGETFPSASLIKVPILVTLMDEVRRGTMRLDERTGMIARDRVPGAGVLYGMESGLNPTLGDLAWLMISVSDNTATNLLLDKLNLRTVWAKMDSLGLPNTRIHAKVFLRIASVAPDSSVKYGLGKTTPDEMVRLFSLLHAGRANTPALDSATIGILRGNQDPTKLTRWLPESISAAHKSGEVDQARNDCGILYGPQAPVAICVMTRENRDTSYAVDNPAHLLIARVSREAFRHWNPSVTLPPLPRM